MVDIYNLGNEYIIYLGNFILGIDKRYIYYDEKQTINKFLRSGILVDEGNFYQLNSCYIDYIKKRLGK
jgi:hypothetical protein